MSDLDLAGLTIPVITPFRSDKKQSVDLKKLGRLVESLIGTQKADALVAVGTTGESTSLTHEEKQMVVDETIKAANGRVPVLAGTGCASTQETIEMTAFAEKAGAAGVLVVSPYYIRPNQEGLFGHFKKIADSTTLPIVLYNHPGRTGVCIEIGTLIKLAKSAKNIVAMKDCPGSLAATTDFARRVRSELDRPFAVLTGEDETIFVNLCLGADGAIAATAHVLGAEIKEMMTAFRANDLLKARAIQFDILDLQRLLFKIPSPAPIKAALDVMGTGLGGPVRPPLVDAGDELKSQIKQQLVTLGRG